MNAQIRLQQLIAFQVLVVGFSLSQQVNGQNVNDNFESNPTLPLSIPASTPTCCCMRMCIC